MPRVETTTTSSRLSALVTALLMPVSVHDEVLELDGAGLELRHTSIRLELVDRLAELSDVPAVAVADDALLAAGIA